MRELTDMEKVLVGKLWDARYDINGIAAIISDKRKDMDAYYLSKHVAEELDDRVSYGSEGWD